MEDDFDNYDDISKIETYAQFLDRRRQNVFRRWRTVSRCKRIICVNKGGIRCKEDFDRKKREIEEMNKEEDTKERPLFSLNMNYRKGSFLDQLQERERERERESEVRNDRKSTIIFIRYKEKRKRNISIYRL